MYMRVRSVSKGVYTVVRAHSVGLVCVRKLINSGLIDWKAVISTVLNTWRRVKKEGAISTMWKRREATLRGFTQNKVVYTHFTSRERSLQERYFSNLKCELPNGTDSPKIRRMGTSPPLRCVQSALRPKESKSNEENTINENDKNQ